MNKLQQLMYNEGERLVPYVSHGEVELVRHRSSYAFFHAVISSDLKNSPSHDSHLSVVDLGFGTGYGCALLSSLPDSRITGVDIAPECEIFARQYYPRTNVNYIIKDLSKFVPEMPYYDYVVSRGVLEHVPSGLELLKDIKFNRRVIIDVPYDEASGNEHHILTGIREEAFSHLDEYEIFYEDQEGAIYDASSRPQQANMIMVVISAPDLPKVSTQLKFPIPAVRSDQLEVAGRANLSGSHYYYDSPSELLSAVEIVIKETEVVADIGCGIVPMNYFRPKLHFMVEPWKEYANILSFRHAGDKSVVILRMGALEALSAFGDNSVDSIFLLDVIEHIEKDEGLKIIHESERVAREQIVIFTPLGFMPQHMESGEEDGWGLSGSDVQEHRSGWLPEDFSASWSFYICKEYHRMDFKGDALENAYGAFYAVRNFETKSIVTPNTISDIRRPLPSEEALQKLQAKYQESQIEHEIERQNLQQDLLQNFQTEREALQTEREALQIENQQLRDAYQILLGSRGVRFINSIEKLLSTLGLRRL